MKNNYNFAKSAISILLIYLMHLSAFAQEKTITGNITSQEDGTPLPGVNILVKGTTTGTVTDTDGNYVLNVPENASIAYSMIGFVPQEVAVGNQSVVDIVLAVDIRQLDEIVITGYGEQSRATVTTSIVTVDAEPLQNIPAGGNALNSLIGKTSGVHNTSKRRAFRFNSCHSD